MDIIQLETVGTELMDLGMIIKCVYEDRELTGIHAHYPFSSNNDKAVTFYLNNDMELHTRYGRERFATNRYSREEMNGWLGIAD